MGVLGDPSGATSPPAAQPLQAAGHRGLVSIATITVCNATGETPVTIHAPREGSDRTIISKSEHTHIVSIHAPREGSDQAILINPIRTLRFNPRTPRGERHSGPGEWSDDYLFQSTHPARGATLQLRQVLNEQEVSIHAPREGSDRLRHSCM